MFSLNQKSFQSRRVFLELGHLVNNSPTTRERKAPQGENLWVFCPETLKNFIVNDKFYSYMLLEISPKREPLVKVFSCEFWKIFQNVFFTEHLQSTASVHDLL